jgi:type III restriction enzyme
VLIDGSIQELTDSSAQAKKNAAEQWCRHATDYNRSIGRKPWKYLLISHDQVQENMSLEAFA